MRGVVARSLQDSSDEKLFAPLKLKKDNLKGATLLGKHATIAFNIAVTPEEQAVVAGSLVKLARNMSNMHVHVIKRCTIMNH